MEELDVFDSDISPRWVSPLGTKVYPYLIRETLAESVLTGRLLSFDPPSK